MHQNIKKIKEIFGNSPDIIERSIKNINYIFLESLSSDDKISNFLNKSITKLDNINNLFEQLKNNIYNSNIKILNNIDECYIYLMSGYTALFIENNNEYIVIETKSQLDRSITESTSEPIIRGPKDSFIENSVINIGLIRKRIKDTSLRIKEIKVGVRTNTKVDIIYLNDIANKKIVDKTIEKIQNICIDGIIDSGYIRDFLEKDEKTSFPLVVTTERPDLTCQNLLNGKIVIMVENSPVVLIIPAFLDDFLKSSEDYYQKSLNATFTRILRYFAFFITILTPALYIALMTFNQEMIPDQLLISLAGQRSQVPFPTFLEVLLYILFFEILRQADVKSPSAAGASMSIVGALILGEASVEAGLVSPMVIIIVALTSICELVFINVDMANAIRQWRMLFIFSTVFMGIIGIVIAGIILITKLAMLEPNDIPYLLPISPLNENLLIDSIIMKPTTKRNKRPNYVTENTTKEVIKS